MCRAPICNKFCQLITPNREHWLLPQMRCHSKVTIQSWFASTHKKLKSLLRSSICIERYRWNIMKWAKQKEILRCLHITIFLRYLFCDVFFYCLSFRLSFVVFFWRAIRWLLYLFEINSMWLFLIKCEKDAHNLDLFESISLFYRYI